MFISRPPVIRFAVAALLGAAGTAPAKEAPLRAGTDAGFDRAQRHLRLLCAG